MINFCSQSERPPTCRIQLLVFVNFCKLKQNPKTFRLQTFVIQTCNRILIVYWLLVSFCSLVVNVGGFKKVNPPQSYGVLSAIWGTTTCHLTQLNLNCISVIYLSWRDGRLSCPCCLLYAKMIDLSAPNNHLISTWLWFAVEPMCPWSFVWCSVIISPLPLSLARSVL